MILYLPMLRMVAEQIMLISLRLSMEVIHGCKCIFLVMQEVHNINPILILTTE